jgi:hypothetical protein
MSDSSLQITDPSAFQERSLGKQIGLSVITFGLYPVYWWHLVHKQLAAGTDADIDPMMRTLLLFVPIYGLWKSSDDASVVTDQDGVVLFLLFLVVAPVGWYMVQSGMNEVAASA